MKNKEINSWILVAAILAIGLQLLLLMGILASKLPTSYPKEILETFIHRDNQITKNYNIAVYSIFVLFNIILIPAGAVIFKTRLIDKGLTHPLARFVLLTTSWAMLGFYAAFKMMVHGYPYWAQVLLYTAVCGNAVTWLMWPFQQYWWPRATRLCTAVLDWRKRWSRMDIFILIGIGLVVMADAPLLHEQLLPYGLNIPQKVLFRRMWVTWGLMAMVYALLRLSLRWYWLAVAGILLFLKWQMFNWGIALPLGVAPVIWAHPEYLMWPSGNLPDLPYIWCLQWGFWGAFDFSFIMPLIYMTGLLQAMDALLKNRPLRLAWWRAALSSLGLLFFSRYVCHPLAFGYLAFSWPLVILLGLWLDDWLSSLKAAALRQGILAVAVIIALAALLTNQLWFIYLLCKGNSHSWLLGL